MTYTQAQKFLNRAEHHGYVRYHNGIAVMEDGNKRNYGINIDGDGHNGRLFGCPEIIWSADQCEERWPTRRYDSRPNSGDCGDPIDCGDYPGRM